jgi:putative zinc finger protein
MTGRVLPLHGSEHTAVDALLPWYVNGTLRGEELARVKEHLTACDQCRREVDWLRDVFAACAAIAPIPDAPPLADIHGIPAFGAPTQPLHGRGRISAGWRSTQPWVRMLVAAQLAALAILGTLLTVDTGNDPSYRTLGSYAQPASTRDAIAVMFDPAMTEAELRRVVTGAGARIVDGPTATHAFVLEVPAAQSPAALQKLRAERSVLFAEPLGARADR